MVPVADLRPGQLGSKPVFVIQRPNLRFASRLQIALAMVKVLFGSNCLN